MPQIIIQRTHEFTNSLRDYRVYIDGIMQGKISDGSTTEFEVDAGSHKLVSKIDWAGSPDIKFDIKEGEIKTFRVGAYKGSNWLLIVTLAIVFIGYAMKRTHHGGYYWVIGIPLFFIVLYYLTVGRKKFLTLVEI